nr:WRKY transcription factor 42 [Manihot esculenta]
MDYPSDPNPNNLPPHQNQYFHQNILDPFPAEFQLSDYLMLDADINGFADDSTTSEQSMISSEQVFSGGCAGGDGGATSRNTSSNRCKKGMKKDKSEVGNRVAFRTKSDLEIMDDGFKWRKYGKKSVKNSPNPRNYYKCSSGGCNVKKRVERDREDSSYVITTYEGIHNHESPCVVYYNQIPADGWSLQPSSSPSQHSSSSS